ncbi:TetR/AcrR family transcriptional regulator [Actinomadura craniellae]|uniref:TetR/AcrR family transcriptional regulator n=1 Tax=Actinomadura craniellae TaxID=2231787 RepID=A0A365HDU0_9ACTN|nr:TetR/AcrR family transcriptional regulator [Actinomadura craniellae]
MVEAAVGLFVRHGVNGTSLQMLADEIGVTKAAVYYHFQNKEDLIEAVVTPQLRRLATVVEAAEKQRRRADQVDTVLLGIIDLLIDNRDLLFAFQFDPAIRRHMETRPDMLDLAQRVGMLLSGPDPHLHTLMIGLVTSHGLVSAAASPFLAHLDDAELRHGLYAIARRILRIKTPVPAAQHRIPASPAES